MVRMALFCFAIAACGIDPDDGIEDDGRVIVTDTQIDILAPVAFSPGSGVLADTPMIDAVAETLLDNPSIVQMSVQGHHDGAEPGGVVLATARAQVVVNALIERGVPADRLSAEPGDEPGRSIDFVIVRRTGE